jgi:triosephosphate isomerase
MKIKVEMRKLIAGNWKMNGVLADLAQAQAVAEGLGPLAPEIVICPPATLIRPMVEKLGGGPVKIGAQDCHAQSCGAFTGDISAPLLKDCGATDVILGHSERRTLHGETDAHVKAKVQAAWAAGLRVILCVGETLDQRKAGATLEIVEGQLRGSLPDPVSADQLVIAYEPVWAIGTGLVPSSDDICAVHDRLRAILVDLIGEKGEDIHLLYGGSVKPDNAKTILGLPNVNGALVGGASLKAMDFLAIIEAA